MSRLETVLDTYYNKIVEYNQTETDFYIQQTINSTIGWINCLREYKIEPNEEDFKALTELYSEACGDFKHLGV